MAEDVARSGITKIVDLEDWAVLHKPFHRKTGFSKVPDLEHFSSPRGTLSPKYYFPDTVMGEPITKVEIEIRRTPRFAGPIEEEIVFTIYSYSCRIECELVGPILRAIRLETDRDWTIHKP